MIARGEGTNEFYVIERAFDNEIRKKQRCSKKWLVRNRQRKHHEKCKWSTFITPKSPVKEVNGIVVWGNNNAYAYEGKNINSYARSS